MSSELMFEKDDYIIPMPYQVMRLPPHSIEAEQAVLGGLLLQNSAWDRLDLNLAATDFYRNDHRLMFAHIATAIGAGHSIDVLLLAEKMKAAGELADAGGFTYLQSIIDGTAGSTNIRAYSEVVRGKSMQRALATAGDTIADMAMNPDGRTIEQLVDEAQSKLMALGNSQSGETQTVGELLSEFDDVLRRRHAKEIVGVPTHFVDIDSALHGLQRGDLIIIAGRPSMGKSAFAFQIAEQVALSKQKVLCFSMEMSKQQFMDRAVSRAGSVRLAEVISGVAYGTPQVTKALERLSDAHLFIDDTAGLSVDQIRARSRNVMRRHGDLDLIVIDYLQLMPGRGINRNTQIEEITRGLKALAKELRVPIVVLSQLNRKCEERVDKRPMMSDLRESGAIEQDADVIMFIYRHEQYYPDLAEWRNMAEIIIAKNRQGGVRIVPMVFYGEYTAFNNFVGEIPQRSRPTQQRGNLS